MSLTFGELIETPVGSISFFAGDTGLQRVAFMPLQRLKSQQNINESIPSLPGLQIVGTLLTEINEFLFGIRKSFSVEIDWRILNGFQREVLLLTVQIPFGEITTYGALAKRLGKPSAARAVGAALGNNPMPMVIPCHRVIAADNQLQGYIGGVEIKASLLELEGHEIENGRVVRK
ncbi:MAG: methylated-DNA--[protein]-cysteine S-methyltransferase [Anaerolineales bacterium]